MGSFYLPSFDGERIETRTRIAAGFLFLGAFEMTYTAYAFSHNYNDNNPAIRARWRWP